MLHPYLSLTKRINKVIEDINSCHQLNFEFQNTGDAQNELQIRATKIMISNFICLVSLQENGLDAYF
jgi:hypothetical protein